MQTVIEQFGHECGIMDYIRDDEHYLNIEKTMLSLKPTWNRSTIKRMVYLAMRQPES